jgi:superfamily II DNA or RNA helicase
MSDIKVQPLQISSLTLAADAQRFALHRAALEWDIQEPIVIDSPADFKSEASWRNTLEPFHHQVQNLISFCRRLPVTLLADDVGLGKTISAGLILSELLARNRLRKALIICPKILMPQWQEELQSKFNIPSVFGSGRSELNDALLEARKFGHGALITTYHSARSHLDMIVESGFQMLILDEAHKLRNLYGTEKQPLMALRIRKALADRTFKYVLMLTATPIQNRLWDLYSLIDLMTVAKGHQNPFGSEEHFARRYIKDSKQTARQINTRHIEEFRSTVFGYMSRVRRADAKLSFPTRKVKLHRVKPADSELTLITVVHQEIVELNKLAQISLLKALVSSPQALIAQLENMQTKGSVSRDAVVRIIRAADAVAVTSKLRGLDTLIDQLRGERAKDWRVVIFTQLRHTQRAIVEHLRSKGIRLGEINGESGRRNQETIRAFSTVTPEINVIVSTEAGAEGVNLQVANVLVNYDLPWNPMIVEQRIGRIQRLGSKHAHVTIFNAILQGTFEEKIVGRLMEKLQLASHAIGDIDSLLEAAGIEGEDAASSFEELIRGLVMASLAGKNIEEDTRLRIESIERAKIEISQEEANINSLLGASEDPLRTGPRAPKMSPPHRSMSIAEFVISAFSSMGRHLKEEKSDIFIDPKSGDRICFDETLIDADSVYPPHIYSPGRPEFDRLVGQFRNGDECMIDGLKISPREDLGQISASWVTSISGDTPTFVQSGTSRTFNGVATLRARISVAHDSFEKIIDADCASQSPVVTKASNSDRIDPGSLELNNPSLLDTIQNDPDVREFVRFYLERREIEVNAAGGDDRKEAKLHEDFTPRMEPSLVGLSGSMTNRIRLKVGYRIDSNGPYQSLIEIDALTGAVVTEPALGRCKLTAKRVPVDCLGTCAVSKKTVLRHLLEKSEISDQYALPEHMVVCAITGKRVTANETATSDITGKQAIQTLMKVSGVSGKRGEPSFFERCQLTEVDALTSEVEISQVSQKKYRLDQGAVSEISGVRGHRDEFVKCSQTGKVMLPSEGERCEVTGKLVAPGILVRCEVSGKRVLPSETAKSDVTGKPAIRSLMKVSGISEKMGEPSFFGRCEFTNVDSLLTELATSQVSEKEYRLDQEAVSAVSGKRGHRNEFMRCTETDKVLLSREGERCGVTSNFVAPGILVRCEISGKHVIPSLTGICAVSGKRVLQEYLATSSISKSLVLKTLALESKGGSVCLPKEAIPCDWDGTPHHPLDTEKCALTGATVCRNFLTGKPLILKSLTAILAHPNDLPNTPVDADAVLAALTTAIGKGSYRIARSVAAPNGHSLAVTVESSAWLGLKKRMLGLLFSPSENKIIGKVTEGRIEEGKWHESVK